MQSFARAAAGAAARVAPRHARNFAVTGAVKPAGIVELREYVVKPEFMGQYMQVSTEGGDLRKRLVPLRLFCAPETGDTLNMVQHFYHYQSLTERQQARDAAQADPEWQQYIGTIRAHLLHQRSTILVEAPFVAGCGDGAAGSGSVLGLKGMCTEFVGSDADAGIYELRRYRLKLGYSVISEFLAAYETGVVAKLKKVAPGSELCTVLHSDVGEISEVIEVWRHASVCGMQESRRNARTSTAWMHAVNTIGDLADGFRTSLVRPAAFSNWK